MSAAIAEQVAAAFQKAITLHQQGRLAEARAAYAHVLRLQPEHVAALNLLGAIAVLMNDPTTALDLFAKAIRIDPKNPEVHVNCGAAYSLLNRHEAAITSYERAIALDPESNVMPYYCRGAALQQLKRYEAAIASYDQAIALGSDLDGDAYHGRGTALVELKQYAAALQSFDKAIASGSHSLAESHCSRGNVLAALKQWDAALDSYERAIALKPDYVEVLSNRGNVLTELGRCEAALASYERAIALKPDYAEAHSNRGVVLAKLKQSQAALASYERAIALKPDYAEAHFNRGKVFAELEQWEAALASYERAVALKPDYSEALSDRGKVLAELEQWEAALASYERAITLEPDYAEAFSNRAVALAGLKRWEAALADFERAIALKPDNADAFSNRAVALAKTKRWEAALADFERAIALKPDYEHAHYNRSTLWLLKGEFAKGWREYEWRWKLNKSQDERHFPQPRWSGEECIEGKTILLYGEQGLGDTLQFCRYASLVADLGARVILEVPAPLLRILSNLRGVSRLLPTGSSLPGFDYHCPLLSLPLAFKTDFHSIPRANRYLDAEAGKVAEWKARLGGTNKARIGLVWSGNRAHKNDRNRSIALADLVRYLPEGFQYISLQIDIREADRRTLQSNPHILNFADQIKDFADTAALCECLDLVISVDTSVVHLNAALGLRTWVLLSFVPDWRWLLDRGDSPWYPSVTLYRQDAAADWSSVLERLRRDLSTVHWTDRRNT
jgi:tetratricopeptide (TPR) repeat protein